MDDQEIENEILSKGLTAPRITYERIEAVMVSEEYHVFSGNKLTVCAITLRNGFIVSGESACVSAANFDADLGRKVAREQAIDKIWMLEAYALQERLYGGADAAVPS